ncbi:MAG: hypothetical protein QOD82_7008, partial [Pseudonocardiales bacterium]|nr:hypothetical protein [Pseudonocardiales bacterium]
LPLAVIAALSVGACGGPAATDAAPTNSTAASSGAVPAVAPPAPATPAVLEYSQQEFCAKASTTPAVVQAYRSYNEYCGIH